MRLLPREIDKLLLHQVRWRAAGVFELVSERVPSRSWPCTPFHTRFALRPHTKPESLSIGWLVGAEASSAWLEAQLD